MPPTALYTTWVDPITARYDAPHKDLVEERLVEDSSPPEGKKRRNEREHLQRPS
jgi:hypothetical protein